MRRWRWRVRSRVWLRPRCQPAAACYCPRWRAMATRASNACMCAVVRDALMPGPMPRDQRWAAHRRVDGTSERRWARKGSTRWERGGQPVRHRDGRRRQHHRSRPGLRHLRRVAAATADGRVGDRAREHGDAARDTTIGGCLRASAAASLASPPSTATRARHEGDELRRAFDVAERCRVLAARFERGADRVVGHAAGAARPHLRDRASRPRPRARQPDAP